MSRLWLGSATRKGALEQRKARVSSRVKEKKGERDRGKPPTTRSLRGREWHDGGILRAAARTRRWRWMMGSGEGKGAARTQPRPLKTREEGWEQKPGQLAINGRGGVGGLNDNQGEALIRGETDGS
jgi:hypothetical protein